MLDMMIVLGCVSQCLDTTAFRHLTGIIEAMLSMSGRHDAWHLALDGPWGQLPHGSAFFQSRLGLGAIAVVIDSHAFA